LAVLLAIAAAPALLFSKSSVLDIFPKSPDIPELRYSGNFSYTQVYMPSGSQWAPGLDEQEVFFASLKHYNDFESSWEIRLGKGGQLYSIRGSFGEGQAPQNQPNAHWIDQIFQLVGVNRARNKNTPGHPYFIHQAGDYLNDPILKSTFYSPMLANEFDVSDRTASALIWGQQAQIPNVNPAGLLYYERLKDLGSGVIEITYVIYNFGEDIIDYLNTPWGGVRKSALPVTLISKPDGSVRSISAAWDDLQWVDLDASAGWIAWTQDSSNPFSPTLALVAGRDNHPRPPYQLAPARFRYGTGEPKHDFEAVEFDPFATLKPGAGMFFRVYMAIGPLQRIQSLANGLAQHAKWGPINFDPGAATLLPVYLRRSNGQTVVSAEPQQDHAPIFYTFAQPVPHSLPLFALHEANSGKSRLSADPCELCTRTKLSRRDYAYKPYAGNRGNLEFLGYVVPKRHAQNGVRAYVKIADSVRDHTYFSAKGKNKDLMGVSP
jgi:hypothetical protein